MWRRSLSLIALPLAASAHAQSSDEWVPAGAIRGSQGIVKAAVTWDPDAAGPQPEVLVVGGDFGFAGGVPVANLAVWDGQAWSAFPLGLPTEVSRLIVIDGTLYAAHGGVGLRRVVEWTGSAWRELATGVRDFLGAYRGQLIARLSGDISAWNGTAWQDLGTHCINPHPLSVDAVGVYDGDLVHARNGGYRFCVSRWDGSTWTFLFDPITTGPQISSASDMLQAPGGLFLAGNFYLGNGIARFNGVYWEPLGPEPLDWGWRDLHMFRGAVHVAGSHANVMRWDEPLWSPLGSPGVPEYEPVHSLCTFHDELIAAGQFDAIGGIDAASIARWDGDTWRPLGLGLQGSCTTSCFANCDCSTIAPQLNVADFTCFVQRFIAGDSYANCDQSFTPPTLNIADFTCFLQRFAAGCP